MNKKAVAILALTITLLIVLVSIGAKKLVLKRNARLVNKINLENKEFLLNLAENYKATKDYGKARGALKEFIKRFPDSKNTAKLRKDIEDLNIKVLFSNEITDDSFSYKIKPGDALAKIASRFNTTVELLKRSNNLKSDLILPEKSLKINKTRFNILVDKSENILTLRKSDGEILKVYSVSTGKNFSTPTGTFKIEEKDVSPTWYKDGAIIQPSSKEYELGSRWMGISAPGYGIHGTKDSTSIGKHITEGCVRMKNQDVEELYAIVPSGTEVTIVE